MVTVIGTSWVVLATIAVGDQAFDVVAHRDLDVVATTTLAGGESNAYNSRGQAVGKRVSPKNRLFNDTRDYELAMTANGEIVRVAETTDIDSYIKNPWGGDLFVRIETLTEGLPQSIIFKNRYLYTVARSWDKQNLYAPRPNGTVWVFDAGGHYVREIGLRSSVKGSNLYASKLWPLAQGRLLALAYYSSGAKPHDLRIEGVPMLEKAKMDEWERPQWYTSYLAVIDTMTGLSTPILGFRQRVSSLDLAHYPNTIAVFNKGRSIATIFDGNLYILGRKAKAQRL